MNPRVAVTLGLLAVASAGCGTSGEGACATNQDCASLGSTFMCRKDTSQCVDLTSERCSTVVGDHESDDAFVFGSILPTTGQSASSGVSMERAIVLAIDDFAQSGGAARPMALVGCSDDGSDDVAVEVANHLVDDVGVPAIIGPAFSGITIKTATEVTIPSGVLLFSPSATSVNITNLDDNGLVWRASPSDTFQARAQALTIPILEKKVRQTLALAPTDNVRLAIAHKGDAYGKDLAASLEQQLLLNGESAVSDKNAQDYLRLNYGNPNDPEADPTKYAETVSAIVDFAPHIVVVLGTVEGVTDIFVPIEEGWQAPAGYRPELLFADGAVLPELWQHVAANDPDGSLRTRIRGTLPGSDSPLSVAFRDAFTAKFPSGSDPNVFGAAGAYDIAYLLAYSAATLGDTPLTGAALSGGLAKLVATTKTKVDVGPANIQGALKALSSGGSIDFTGASGPLDLDLATGEAPSDIQVWCLPKDPDTGKAAGAVNSGLYYDATTLTLSGAIGAVCD